MTAHWVIVTDIANCNNDQPDPSIDRQCHLFVARGIINSDSHAIPPAVKQCKYLPVAINQIGRWVQCSNRIILKVFSLFGLFLQLMALLFLFLKVTNRWLLSLQYYLLLSIKRDQNNSIAEFYRNLFITILLEITKTIYFRWNRHFYFFLDFRTNRSFLSGRNALIIYGNNPIVK